MEVRSPGPSTVVLSTIPHTRSLLSLMHDTVVEFGEFGVVPAFGGADKISCDTLQAVDVVASASGTCIQTVGCVLITAVHAAVAVMIHRAVAYVVAVHQIHNLRHCFGVVGGIAVDFDVEYMSPPVRGWYGASISALCLGEHL